MYLTDRCRKLTANIVAGVTSIYTLNCSLLEMGPQVEQVFDKLHAWVGVLLDALSSARCGCMWQVAAGCPPATMSAQFGQRLPSEMPNGVDGSHDGDGDESGQEQLLGHHHPSDIGDLGNHRPAQPFKTVSTHAVQVFAS